MGRSKKKSNKQGHREEQQEPQGHPLLPWAVGFLAILTVVCLGLYLQTLDYKFINYDVYDQIIDNPKVTSLAPANLYRIFTELSATSYYPIRLLSFAFDYAVWELNPRGYHLTNVMIHLGNTLLLYWLILRLGLPSLPGPHAKRSWPVLVAAFSAALLFVVHPVVAEPVCWQGAREELLMLFFTLACVHFHHSARVRYAQPPKKTEKPERKAMVAFHALAALSAFCACTSSAMGAAVVLIVTGYELALVARPTLPRILASTWLLWLISIATVILKKITHQADLDFGSTKLTVAERALVVLDVYYRNIKTLFWPRELTLLYPHHIPAGPFDFSVIAGALLVVATLLLLWFVRRKPLVLFGLIWFVAALAPSAQVLPHQHFRADRFLYSPLAGLAMAVTAALVLILYRYRKPLAIGLTAVAITTVVLAVRTAFQLPLWKNNITLFTHCIEVHPTALAYNNRGTTYGRMNEYAKAAEDFTESLKLQPDTAGSYVNRAQCYYHLERWVDTVKDCNQAIALNPDISRAYYLRGLSLLQIKQYGAAREDLQHVLETAPDTPFAEHSSQVLSFLDQKGL